MNKFGFAAVVASGLTAAILGLAAPAQAATAVNAPTSRGLGDQHPDRLRPPRVGH